MEHRGAHPASTYDFVGTEGHRRLENLLLKCSKDVPRWSTSLTFVGPL